ncbi:MAG: ATP-binding protein [Actinobacteria bacterium]|nr:ATP-binding protein [Actinomycetota bacterium]
MRTPLAATNRAAGRARSAVTEALRAWGIGDDLTQAAVLLASELVTNAVKVSGADDSGPAPVAPEGLPVIGLQVWVAPGLLTLEVWDSSPEVPSESHPEAEAEGGRGLWLVTLYGWRWGVVAGRRGKVVYAEREAEVISARASDRLRLPERVCTGTVCGAGQWHHDMHAAFDARLLAE